MSDQRITNVNEMRSDRYEIEPRPLPVGGGWRIRFFGKDLETGQEIEMEAASFRLRTAWTRKTLTPRPSRPARNGYRLRNTTNGPPSPKTSTTTSAAT